MNIYKILFFSAMLAGQLPGLNAQARFEFNETSHDFGEVQEGTKAVHEFVFKNIGDGPLIISNVRASCGCTTPFWTKEPVLPGKTGVITASFNSQNRPGAFNKSISIISNTTEPNKVLYIKGMVLRPGNAGYQPSAAQLALSPLIKIDKQVYELGNVAIGQTVPVKIPIKNEGKRQLAIVNITASCRCIKVDPSAKRIFKPGEAGSTQVLFSPRATGAMNQQIVVQSTDLKHPKTILTLKATVVEKLGEDSMIKTDKKLKF